MSQRQRSPGSHPADPPGRSAAGRKAPGIGWLRSTECPKGSRSTRGHFVTGSESFALRAFETEAADYLLKPFNRERLQTALRRVRERLSAAGPNSEQSEPPKPLERLTIKSDGRISIVRTAEVDWLSAADNYVEIHVGKSSHLMRTIVAALLARLPAKLFARISRSALVNLERVKEIHPQTHGDNVLVLNNGTPARLT